MVQKYLKYTIASADQPKTSYINLARDLSAINRQLFRQARMYKMKSITVIDNDQDKYVQVGIAPNTWAMKNSVKRAFNRWCEMNAQVLQDQPSLKARWNDFKPYLSRAHMLAVESSLPLVTMETPEDMNGNNLKYGEWAHSMFESPDGTSSVDGYKVGVIGAHVGSVGAFEYVGLIQSYGDSRGTVSNQEPTVDASAASDDPLLNLLDAGTQFDEIAENIIEEGDRPPYRTVDGSGTPGDFYVGGLDNMQHELMVAEFNPADSAQGLQRAYNIDVPLGVLRVDHKSGGETNFTVIIELAEGSYKGIHSTPMVDTKIMKRLA